MSLSRSTTKSSSHDDLGRQPDRKIWEIYHEARGHPSRRLEVVSLKGQDIQRPSGIHFHDRDGTRRAKAHIRWWNRNTPTLKSAAIGAGAAAANLPYVPVHCLPYSRYDPTTFFGYYWRSGEPKIEADNFLCLDYSVVQGGELVGYRSHPSEPLYENKIVVQRA